MLYTELWRLQSVGRNLKESIYYTSISQFPCCLISFTFTPSYHHSILQHHQSHLRQSSECIISLIYLIEHSSQLIYKTYFSVTMRYSSILAVAGATLVLATPVPSPDSTKTITVNGQTYTVTISSLGGDNSKRSHGLDTSLDRRGDKVSSCGSGGDNWIPVDDFACSSNYNDAWCTSGAGWAGYRSAVTAFCAVVSYDSTSDRVVVPPGAKASLDIWTTGTNVRNMKPIGRDFGGPVTTKVGQASIGCEFLHLICISSRGSVANTHTQSRSTTRAVTTTTRKTRSASQILCKWHKHRPPAMERTTRIPRAVHTSMVPPATTHCLLPTMHEFVYTQIMT